MTEPTPTPPRDPVREQLGEASLRLLAGVVPAGTMAELRGEIMSSPEAFPWKAVNERILADPVDAAQLTQAGLRGQRDWILRTGRPQARPPTRRRSMKVRTKSLVAYLIVRSVFFVVYAAALIVVLILLKHHWSWFDIYSVLDWLRDQQPDVLGLQEQID